jgi:hypothetical protein
MLGNATTAERKNQRIGDDAVKAKESITTSCTMFTRLICQSRLQLRCSGTHAESGRDTAAARQRKRLHHKTLGTRAASGTAQRDVAHLV